jgi:hypothetical protein
MDRQKTPGSLATGGEWWSRLAIAAVAAALLASAGCAALPGPLGQSTRDQAIRKQAQADSFPTASQVGL